MMIETPKQAEFLAHPGPRKAFIGKRGSGKTTAAVLQMLAYSEAHEGPGVVFAYDSLTLKYGFLPTLESHMHIGAAYPTLRIRDKFVHLASWADFRRLEGSRMAWAVVEDAERMTGRRMEEIERTILVLGAPVSLFITPEWPYSEFMMPGKNSIAAGLRDNPHHLGSAYKEDIT